MSSRDLVGSSSNSSRSSRNSDASSSGSLSSFARSISSAFSSRSTSLVESPTSSVSSPQEKSTEFISDTTAHLNSRNELLSGQDSTEQFPAVIPAARNGPSALARLQNVQNVFCVAFGIFDRYYIAWEDTNGKQHQESNKLPPLLHEWLYPASGQTRHLPSLQVSFGTNDEFFASDEDDKISSRDSIPSTGNHSRGSSLTNPIVRTNSPPALTRNGGDGNHVALPQSRLKRRSTMFNMESQVQNPTRSTMERREPLDEISQQPVVEAPVDTTDTYSESPLMEAASRVSSGLSRRRSVRVSIPRIRTSWLEQNPEASNVPTREVYNTQRNYVDTCVQTDLQGYHLDEYLNSGYAPTILHQEPQYQPVQVMPFGVMQDYFRGQYSLGDALYYR